MHKFSNIQRYLLSKQKEVIGKLKLLDEQELSFSNTAPESVELGTYSWEADTNSTKTAIKTQLVIFSKQIHETLSKLQKGTYGFCERCHSRIEQARLKIIPTATHCIVCL